MGLGCGLTSVRGNRGENYENEQLVHQKQRKKNLLKLVTEVFYFLVRD
jgi:hypothetical protein